MGNVNSIVKGIVAGLIFFVFGAVMFVHFGDGQRKYEAKLQSIRAGKVQPEVLTVTSKYNSQNRAGQRTYPHFVCSASRQARIVLLPPLSLYDSIKTGDSITGYYFPDGYLVPGWRSRDASSVKWIFLGIGVLSGAGVAVSVFAASRKRQNAA
jgi:hypothetical protein